MSDIETITVVLTAGWLALLTLGLVLTVRQVALLMAAPATRAQPSLEPTLFIGTPVPNTVKALEPELDRELRYILFFSPTCAHCRTLASEICDAGLPMRNLLAVVPGANKLAEEIAQCLQAEMRVVRDPEASEIATEMAVRVTPLAVEVQHGIVSGYASLAGVGDLTRLINARAHSDAEQMARSLREVIDSVT